MYLFCNTETKPFPATNTSYSSSYDWYRLFICYVYALFETKYIYIQEMKLNLYTSLLIHFRIVTYK